MDVLSDAIAAVRVGQPTSNRLQAGSTWCYRFAPYEGAGFHVLLRGSGWLLPDGGTPVALGPGDAVLVPHGGAHTLSSAPDAAGAVPFETAVAEPDGRTEFLCGKYRLAHPRRHPLLASLPEVVHLPAEIGRQPELRAAIDLLGGEVSDRRPGSATVLTGLLDLLLVYLIRAWLDGHPGTGWPQALRDPEIAAALEALHEHPEAPWRIEDLAARVGLSRATLARRFTALTGQPPMAYLTWWRLTTAARLLQDTDLPLPSIAANVGYASPFAFSHAFKRQFGVAPGGFRAGR
ncbi:AraC family transcriptional regulator [Amycolatopsis balhimycina DSM 5908]|uniref:AraC family transcriptional regulator n=1 Tax=Amycolatopsis balhimycina DSM 5908 TaxID=1081091 RepID=A0A428WSI0_AMYBA|nr:AraC family transcriptional regulator [Amycolatopsis balhimycina]RSM46027.1 AraC family transcriptional regulator [Amycolatopsis balhimycina DSM 5908]